MTKHTKIRKMLNTEVELVQGDEIIARGKLITGSQPMFAINNTLGRIRKIEFGASSVDDIFGSTIVLK